MPRHISERAPDRESKIPDSVQVPGHGLSTRRSPDTPDFSHDVVECSGSGHPPAAFAFALFWSKVCGDALEECLSFRPVPRMLKQKQIRYRRLRALTKTGARRAPTDFPCLLRTVDLTDIASEVGQKSFEEMCQVARSRTKPCPLAPCSLCRPATANTAFSGFLG